MKKVLMPLLYFPFLLIILSCGGEKSSSPSKNSGEKISKESLTDDLMKSAGLGDLSKVRSLIEESGADPKWKNNFGRAALHYAAFSGHLDVMKYLIEKGADINVQDKEKLTALHYVAMRWRNLPWDRKPNVLTYFMNAMKEECKSEDLSKFQNDLDKFVENFLLCSVNTEADTEINILESISGKNSGVSFEHIQKEAEKGKAIIQFILGLLYDKGQGISQDHEKAFEWYEKAAEQGYEKAQVMLGIMYEEGRGVSQDHEKALEWYGKAAEQGYEKAKEALKKLQDENKK